MRILILMALVFAAQVNHADECDQLVEQAIEAGVDVPIERCEEIRAQAKAKQKLHIIKTPKATTKVAVGK